VNFFQKIHAAGKGSEFVVVHAFSAMAKLVQS
jgi:hypothetical protein